MDITPARAAAARRSAPPPAGARADPRLITAYATTVGVVGTVVTMLVYLVDSPLERWAEHPVELGVLALALVLGELTPIPVSRGDDMVANVTVSSTFATALLVLGPLSLLLLVHTVAVLVDDLRGRRRLVQMLFNAGQYAISLVVARLVFCALAGVDVFAGYQAFRPDQLPAALAGGFAFALVNDVLVSTVVALVGGQRVRVLLRENLRFKLETSGVLVALGPVAALLVDVSVLMLPLLAVPVLAVRRTAYLAALRERQSLRDPLTGLANRELFRRRVDRALTASAHHDPGVAVLLIDMDHFKDVNDTLGHHAGDELLCRVATRIEAAARADLEPGAPGDLVTVARLGGDEFAVLLVAEDPVGEAVRLADRLLERVSRPLDVQGSRLSVQGSIGITTTAGGAMDVHALLKEADIALYEAKRERARHSTFKPGTVTGSAERLRLLPALRETVDSGGLHVLYQPQLDVAAGRVVAVEALVRWDHPVEGRLGPHCFIELAESAGLIGRITTQVLDAALDAGRHWRGQGWDVSVSVNLSARQLSDLSLPERVRTMLDRRGVPASALTIEVTENSLMSDTRQATTILCALRSMGVRLAIDDFGTGYSSLALLQRLAVDELKVDRSFVSGLVPGGSDEILVRSIIELGHNLGLRVVAEGVETPGTAKHLRRLGCDRLQGYLVGRPMPRAAVDGLLAAAGVQQRVDLPPDRADAPGEVGASRRGSNAVRPVF